MKLLVIDDDDLQLSLASAAIESCGIEDAVLTSDPISQIEAIAAGNARYDVILLDIVMPEIDGIEVCHRLRKLPEAADTAIIMMTAMSDRAHIDKAFKAGAADYIIKPFDAVELERRLKAATTRQGKERAVEAEPTTLFRGEEIDIGRLGPVTDHHAMEAYMQTLSRSKAALSTATAIRVARWEEITADTSEEERLEILKSAVDAINGALERTSFVLSYYGEGVFVTVSRRADPVLSAMFARQLEIPLPDGGRAELETFRSDAPIAQISTDPLATVKSALSRARGAVVKEGRRTARSGTGLPDLFAI